MSFHCYNNYCCLVNFVYKGTYNTWFPWSFTIPNNCFANGTFGCPEQPIIIEVFGVKRLVSSKKSFAFLSSGYLKHSKKMTLDESILGVDDDPPTLYSKHDDVYKSIWDKHFPTWSGLHLRLRAPHVVERCSKKHLPYLFQQCRGNFN
jgi:hypothetical protein